MRTIHAFALLSALAAPAAYAKGAPREVPPENRLPALGSAAFYAPRGEAQQPAQAQQGPPSPADASAEGAEDRTAAVKAAGERSFTEEEQAQIDAAIQKRIMARLRVGSYLDRPEHMNSVNARLYLGSLAGVAAASPSMVTAFGADVTYNPHWGLLFRGSIGGLYARDPGRDPVAFAHVSTTNLDGGVDVGWQIHGSGGLTGMFLLGWRGTRVSQVAAATETSSIGTTTVKILDATATTHSLAATVGLAIDAARVDGVCRVGASAIVDAIGKGLGGTDAMCGVVLSARFLGFGAREAAQ